MKSQAAHVWRSGAGVDRGRLSDGERPAGLRGVSLLITLVFISGTALVVLALLMVSREKTRYSGYSSHAARSELAVRAGLEEAKMLLLNATANDRYLVSCWLDGPEGADVSQQSRYYYILDPQKNGMRFVPLFAGGKLSERPYPADPHEGGLAPAGGELFARGLEMAEAIHLPPLTHDTGAALVREKGRVRTGWVYPAGLDEPRSAAGPGPSAGKNSKVRYTYWIEDLEGYPDLDSTGMPSETDPEGLALCWHGYEAADPRVGRCVETGCSGYRYEFPENNVAGRGFPYAQRVAGQVSPGLSVREVHVFPWSKPYFAAPQHPYSGFAALRRNPWLMAAPGSEVLVAPLLPGSVEREWFARRVERRFAFGLRPSLRQPLIPYGLGYADEGQPAANLNALVHAGAVDGIAEMVRRNLPSFESRKGGFPEDYLRTLAASVVDYADTDSRPTLSRGVYRGMDSMPVMNEVFFRIEYQGYGVSPDGKTFQARFQAEPFVEFWNLCNRKASLTGLSLRVSIPDRQGLVVKTGSGQTGSFSGTEVNRAEPDHPSKVNLTVSLEPNEYRVVAFGRMRWEFAFPTQGLAVLSLGRIKADKAGLLGGKDGGNSRVHFELLWAPDPAKPETTFVIDATGRPGPGDESPSYGFHLRRYGEKGDYADDMYRSGVPNTDNSLTTGEYMIRAAAPGLCVSLFEEATNYGDARMGYYPNWAQKTVYYTWDSSPGYRNVLLDKCDSGSYTQEARSRDWPDGGYDAPASPAARVEALVRKHPVRPTELDAPEVGDQRPLLAPARISNEGRFYSLAELGHVFDPVMWRPDETTKASQVSRGQVLDISTDAVPDPCWGGGNSLRMGRKEHPQFDQLGRRASQLLDLFHVGVPGTNCQFGGYGPLDMTGGRLPEDLYAGYDVMRHQPPPTARNRAGAVDPALPYHRIYAAEHHAESPCRWVQGHLNLNSVPTTLEIETLLRGPFSSPQVTWSGVGWKTLFASGGSAEQEKSGIGAHQLNEDAVSALARTIYEARPFLCSSHLAQVIGKAVDGHLPQDASLPPKDRARSYCSDALAEEIFARMHNTTTLSSRNFRIYVHGEVVSNSLKLRDGTLVREGGQVLARASAVYQVFVRPLRAADGRMAAVRLEVLNSIVR